MQFDGDLLIFFVIVDTVLQVDMAGKLYKHDGIGSPAIGIDLGTTNSCVAVCKHDGVEVIPNDQGNYTTPSCVTFTNSEHFIGEAAKNEAYRNSFNTISGEF